MSDAPTLSLQHITRRFGTVQALQDASLHLRPGTIHALLGENGAGKTTLMRIAFGMLRCDSGVIALDGEPASIPSPAAALARGVGMVHQHFTLVPAMTVAENVALGMHGLFQPARARVCVEETARTVGFRLDPNARVGDLSVAAQQRVEIVKALARGVRILILDEPTAVLAPAEAAELLAMLRRFANAGGAVVLITHKLREALASANDVTVLRAGRTVLTASAAEADVASVARAMVGGAAPEREQPGPAPAPGDPVLAVTDLVVADAHGAERVRGVTLSVRAGEILGVAGVEGAGQHELLLVLAGRLRPNAGRVRLARHVGFVPEDRQRGALVLGFTLAENVALRDAGRARGTLRWRAIRARTAALLALYDVRALGPDAPAFALSGGNQQKLVMARELEGAPEAVVAENPTRGLDITATAAVHARLRQAAARGAAVVVYSSDLDELLAIAHRVVVLHAGRAREVAVDRAAVARALVGVA